MKKIASWPRELKAIAAVLVTGLLVVGVRCGVQMWAARGPVVDYVRALPDHAYVAARLAGQDLRLEVVNSEQSISQGLSDREAIGSDGMLFVMPTRGTHPFWMPRMHFDLDIIWLDDGGVVDISAGVPAQPGVPLAALPLYTSRRPVNLVLEVAAGQAQAWGVQVGERLEIQR